MSDLFENDEFDTEKDLDVEAAEETLSHDGDARRRLEDKLEERRLREELDDLY